MTNESETIARQTPRYRHMIQKWLDIRQHLVDTEKARRKVIADIRWAPKKQETSEKRRERDRMVKRELRGSTANTVRQYTDCSKMTAEEKAKHVREREREKKRRQRAKARARTTPYAGDPRFGRY